MHCSIPFLVDWIFSHDLDVEMAMEEQAAATGPATPAPAAAATPEPGHRDGTKYKLVSSGQVFMVNRLSLTTRPMLSGLV